MPLWHTREELLHQTITLHSQGLTRRAIARALSISRNTVRKLLTEHGLARLAEPSALRKPPERAPRASKLDSFRSKARAPASTSRRPRSHQPWKKAAADLDQLRLAFDHMGPRAAAFFAGLTVATPRLAGYHARQILLLRERYTTADLDSALGHARSHRAFDHHAVGRILARAAPRTLAEYVTEHATRRLEERLGDCDTRPRDLDEYDRLPVAPPPVHPPSSPSTESPCPSDPIRPMPTPSPTGSDDPSGY